MRLLCTRIGRWQLGDGRADRRIEGVVGLWLSVELNAPPGAAIAVLAGAVFAIVAIARVVVARRAAARALLAAPVAVMLALLAAGCGSTTHARPGQVRRRRDDDPARRHRPRGRRRRGRP